MRTAIQALLRRAYQALPVSTPTRLRLKSMAFKALGPLVSRSTAYQAWLLQGGIHGGRRQHAGGVALQLPGLGDSHSPADAEAFVEDSDIGPPTILRARLIAFYLPQFHPIPENDRWWGKGFTEWRNVTRGAPRFPGHYQPHLPLDLGFYDLRLPEVQGQQVDLAKRYGVSGFCFYFYWFGGIRLLETPIQRFAQDERLDLEFCLCWANENWTRRWDGLDDEVLMGQSHSAEDDLAFILHVSRYFVDPRYIRIDGKPLLLIYRPDLLPDMRATAKRWRKWAAANGHGELHLAYVQTYESVPPASYGLDSAVEFPPNNSQPIDVTARWATAGHQFEGRVYDWEELAQRRSMLKAPDYLLFRGVCPSWDNEARRQAKGTLFAGSTPAGYASWLNAAVVETGHRITAPESRLVFINAWNEWAEGAHLEPDLKYGHAWLAATRSVVSGEFESDRLILLVHDGFAHGAQKLALQIATQLTRDFHLQIATVILEGGPLVHEFSQLGETHLLEGISPSGAEARGIAESLVRRGFANALCNTTASGEFLKTLSDCGIHCVALIHELPGYIDKAGLRKAAHQIARHAAKLVFPSDICSRAFVSEYPVPPERVVIRPQGLYATRRTTKNRTLAKLTVCEHLGMEPTNAIVLGAGFADRRKGVDLFVGMALRLARLRPAISFVWLGDWDGAARAEADQMLADSGLGHRFFFPGQVDDLEDFYAAAEVFALTSREDPFPSVVLESLAASTPVVAFRSSGGFEDLLSRGTGTLVTPFDLDEFAVAVASFLDGSERREKAGSEGRRIVEGEFSFRSYLFDLLELARLPRKRVSVIVPNYNYAQFIEQRIHTILGQRYPVFELILLDDASTDDSVERMRAATAGTSVSVRFLENEVNSGSVFAQWKSGVLMSRGDLVWIAEADDLSAPGFLEQVVAGFDRSDVVLSYCDSRQIDEHGYLISDGYAEYLRDISTDKWLHKYVAAGKSEVAEALSIKNTIPNVSAVLFKLEPLLRTLEDAHGEIQRFRYASDWAVYLRILLGGGSIAYSPNPSNLHRRHERGLTISSFHQKQWEEIREIQLWVRDHCSLSAASIAKADAYSGSLRNQFRLNGQPESDGRP